MTAPEVVEPVAHRAVWLPAPGGGPVGARRASSRRRMRPRPEPTPTDDLRLGLLRTPADGSGHPGVARNRLLAATDEPFLAVLDDGDEPIGDALERMADLLRDDPALDAVLCPATYGETLVNVLLPDDAAARRAGLPHPRLRGPPDRARGAGRVHRGPGPGRAGRPPLLALADLRRRAHRRAPPDRAGAEAGVTRPGPRLTQALLLGAAVAAFVALGAVWLWRFRRGQPVDIDEAGYLAIAINDYRGLHDQGLGGCGTPTSRRASRRRS